MLADRYPDIVEEIRGQGFLMALKCKPLNSDVAAAMREEHLLGVLAGDNTVRLMPPLTIPEKDHAEGVKRLEAACSRLRAAGKAGAAAGLQPSDRKSDG